MSLIWVNDGLVDETTARVSPLDHGFTVADGVFETLKVKDGQPFALDRHVERLKASANGLGLGDINTELVEKAIVETLSANSPIELGRLRVTITSGQGPLGSNRGDTQHTLTVATASVNSWPATTTVAIVPWRRNERSAVVGLKTTSYAENVVALEAAHTAGYSEAIFLDTQDRLSEGTGTNLFFVTNNTVMTPSVKCGILEGITRALVIELCADLSIDIVVDEFTIADLIAADEIFITSSTRDVHPVTTLAILNQQLISETVLSKSVGPVTSRLLEAWSNTYSMNTNP